MPQIAKKEHLAPLELELRMLEDKAKLVHQEFQYQKGRERAMRNTNESTNERVTWLSVIGMLLLLGLSAWQVLYLRHYFVSQKLM